MKDFNEFKSVMESYVEMQKEAHDINESNVTNLGLKINKKLATEAVQEMFSDNEKIKVTTFINTSKMAMLEGEINPMTDLLKSIYWDAKIYPAPDGSMNFVVTDVKVGMWSYDDKNLIMDYPYVVIISDRTVSKKMPKHRASNRLRKLGFR